MRITYVIFLLLTLMSCKQEVFKTDSYTECNEYGIIGSIKEVTTRIYNRLNFDGNKWIVEESKLSEIQVFQVNEDNNFDVLTTSFDNRDGGFYTVNQYFVFEGNKKTHTYTLSSTNDTLYKGIIDWLNDKHYQTTTKSSNYMTVQEVFLDENFREKEVKTNLYVLKGDSAIYVSTQEYSRTFVGPNDKYGSRVRFYDSITDEESIISLEIIRTDKKGNLLEFALVDDKGKLYQYAIRTIEYR